jgi:hypothetical protein
MVCDRIALEHDKLLHISECRPGMLWKSCGRYLTTVNDRREWLNEILSVIYQYNYDDTLDRYLSQTVSPLSTISFKNASQSS